MAKKKYAIQWENDEAVVFEINGKVYKDLDEVPDHKDQLKLMAMMSAAENVQTEDNGVPIEKVILSIFTGVAILMLAIAGISVAMSIRQISREEIAPAVVTDMLMRYEYDENDSDRVIGETYYPKVRFTASDGRRREVQLSEGSFPPAYEIGDEVNVRYNPENPLEARIDSAASTTLMFVLPAITGTLGLGFLIAVIAVLRVISKQ